MLNSEKELEHNVYNMNVSRTHNRSLFGDYGYNKILNLNIVDECIQIAEKKQSVIRVLDIGSGNGFAMQQLRSELESRGLINRFEIYGMGLNEYNPHYIPTEYFIKSGLYNYAPEKPIQFDLIISVYTFQYLWHKLEGIEKIHNTLLCEGGKAIIHFPGYLVFFSERSNDILHNERIGNREFVRFLDHWKLSNTDIDIAFKINEYTSEDEADCISTEFGIITINKVQAKQLLFRAVLNGFSIYDEGFIFDGEVTGLSYISSFYKFATLGGKKNDDYLQEGIHTDLNLICRINTLKKKYEDTYYRLHFGIHCMENPVIVGIYPAAREELSGNDIPYLDISNMISHQNLGAVVRCNGLQTAEDDFHEFNDYFVRIFIDYILDNAENICGNKNPKIYLMGYSSGGSAIASVASEYKQVEKLLLLAPSHDSDIIKTKNSLLNYEGELYVVTGDQDKVVSPKQAAWFYFQSSRASKRKFVVLNNCNHSFSGDNNLQLVIKSPLWAFKGLQDFPSEKNISDDQDYLNYFNSWNQQIYWK